MPPVHDPEPVLVDHLRERMVGANAATPGCHGLMGAAVENAIAERLLAAVPPDQIALALSAADTVADRRGRAPARLSYALNGPATTRLVLSARFTRAQTAEPSRCR